MAATKNWLERSTRYLLGALGHYNLLILGSISTPVSVFHQPYKRLKSLDQRVKEIKDTYHPDFFDSETMEQRALSEAQLQEERQKTEGPYEERAKRGTRLPQ
jgi:isocitrate dehydrogenase kinase/phosphatase